MKDAAPAYVGRYAIVLVTDDQALGDTIENRLAEAGIEVTQVHDPIVALGVIETRPEAGLLLTEISVHQNKSQALALTVRNLVHGVGVVFMTARPHLIDAGGRLRDLAFAKPVDLAELAPEIRHRLTR